jgi:hypothetical protein
MNVSALCGAAPCSLVEFYRRFRCAYRLHHGDGPEYGGSKRLWNVCKRLPDYTAQHPRKQSSSHSPPWEHETSPSPNELAACKRRGWLSYLFIYSLFNDAVSSTGNIAPNKKFDARMTNWKGCWRKRPWPNLRYYPGILLEGLRKTTKTQDSRYPGRDMNPGTHEYEAGR